jgi:hypothetical protein
MPKCFFTGIEIQMEDAYLLDRSAAKRALRNLRLRLAAVERLVSQLSPKDDVEAYDHRSNSTKVRSERRLVCATVAGALSASYPESPLFVAWPKFAARRPPVFPEMAKASPVAGAAKTAERRAIALGSPVRPTEASHAAAQ